MPSPPLPSLDPSIWEELRLLGQNRKDERALLDRLLELWCQVRGVREAALYVRTDAGLKRETVYGSRSFALYLEPAAAAGLSRLDVPGGRVLFEASVTGGAAESMTAPLELLLATVVRSRRLGEQLKQRRFQDSYRGVELEALYDVGLAIASTLNLEELSEEILLRAVALLDARRGALFLLDGDSYERNRTIGGDARESVGLDDPQVGRLLAADGSVPQDVLPGATYPLAVPVEIEGAPRGLLVVADKESRRGVGPFVEADRRMLSLFANQAAIALENAALHRQALEKERLERELELAAEIQRGILPATVPEVPGFELTGWNRPTRLVGGDYYGFLPLSGGRLGLVVADVTGKGMPAALLVSTLHSGLNLLLDQLDIGDQLWSRLNQHIVDASATNKFITLLLVDLDPKNGHLRYLNAGHNPGLLLRHSGGTVELTSSGVPLGLMSGITYRSQKAAVAPGDLLCLYSDGITECLSPGEDEFGVHRLEDLLKASQGRSLNEIVLEIEAAVREFAGGRPQGDDQTVVLLRRL